jgi:hypothetical protein
MYPISIQLGDARTPGSVLFQAFRGVGPRRFFDLFSIGLSAGYAMKRKRDGKKMTWAPGSAPIRVPLAPSRYLEREKRAFEKLKEIAAAHQES